MQGSAPPQINVLSRYLLREGNHLSFVMATRGLQLGEFPSLYLACRGELSQPAALIMRAVSHWHQTLESQEAPRHGECATRLHPHVTAAIFHIKGHQLTLIVREVGGVLKDSRMNVPVLPDASL